MSCPICVSPEGTAITAGMRAGAGVLIVVIVMVIGMMMRFGYRLWAAEAAAGLEAAEGTEHSETDLKEAMTAHE